MRSGNGVRAVLFDAGNTLVHIDAVRMVAIFRQAGAATTLEGFWEAERAARRTLHERVDAGSTGTEPEIWQEYFIRLFLLSGVPEESLERVGAMVRDVHRADHLWTHVEPGTAELLGGLSARGYRLAVISNADGRMEDVLVRCGLREHFEFVIDSDVVGVAKPEPAIFEAACRALQLEAGECLYVGDLYPVDYLGATGAGLSAVLLDPLGVHRGRAPRVERLPELAGWLAARSP